MKLVLSAIITVLFLILPLNIALAVTTFDGDVQILESDETGITFTYVAPSAVLATPDGYPDNYKAPEIPRTARIAQPGTPLLPVKVIPIGVPFDSKPSIKVINGQYTPLAKAEVPNFIIEKTQAEFEAKASSQATLKSWPYENVYIESENVIRGLRVLKVCLAAAKLEGGMLYQAESITVRIDYNSSGDQNRYQARPNGQIFEKVLSSIVANHEIARNWRVQWPPIPFRTASAQSSFDSSQVWIKLEIAGSGIYKVSRFELNNIGVNVSEIDPRELRVFYGGGAELPVDNDLPRPEFQEIPIYVSGADDGEFNSGDQLLFYAESVDRPIYSEDDERYIQRTHHYTSRNSYWLTYSGDFGSSPERWTNVDGSIQQPSAIALSSFNDYIHEEQELVFYIPPSFPGNTHPEDHFDWYWGNQTDYSISRQVKDIVSGSQAHIITKTKSTFDTLLVNNIFVERDYYNSGYTDYYTTDLRSGFNTLLLKDGSNFHLDFIDIHYERWLNVDGGQLEFYGPEQVYTYNYRLTSVPSDYTLLDISSASNVSRITGGELDGDELRFQSFSDGRKRFYLCSPDYYKQVFDYELYEPDDLRSTMNEADYIIITPDLFYDQSLELAAHRESITPGLRTRVVKVEDIYNQFSWGLFDALAIRDFLKYAFENWANSPPSYVALIGDGHYDYRDNMNNNVPNRIPPFESTQSSTGRAGSGSDESYIYFGEYGYLDSDGAGGLDMIIGRIPANNTDEMEIVLDKIINYEVNPNMGKWRNKVVIVADDNNTPDRSTERDHTRQAEALANDHVPPEMEIQKIYMVEFPLRAGRTKPDAREALINAFNNGGLIINWIGHGNKGLWAHEQLFRRIEDMPRLVNDDQLPLVFTASCSIAYYDHPLEQGMAEDFVRHPGGGGITSIGATRLVYSAGNSELNKDVFDQLLFDDSVSFGQALYVAKYLREIPPGGPDTNRRKFMLLGEPALIAGKPSLEAVFTYEPDSLRGLTVDSIAGEIVDDLGELQSDFNGTVWTLVKDASVSRHKALVDYSGNLTGSFVDYELPGPTIFNGPAEVVDGHFSTSFFIPKDITYGGSGAKIFVYFENGYVDGSGVIDSLPMAGGVSDEPDSSGPTVDIYFEGHNISDQVQAVPNRATFEVRLFDLHGINITGSMGHSIVIEVDDGDTYSMDITDNFIFDRGNWQQGSAVFELPDLSEGDHLLSLKAWDNYNNSTLISAYIQVFAGNGFEISEVMNYPNPVIAADSTVFQYMLTNDAEAVSLKLFTLAGRKIKSFDLSAAEYKTSGYHHIPYYLRDSDGDRLASGVYIYKIVATGTGFDGERRKSDFQSKLAIIR